MDSNGSVRQLEKGNMTERNESVYAENKQPNSALMDKEAKNCFFTLL